jgi:segregation and condensation protein B
MEEQKTKRIVEALIFASDTPLSADRIKEAMDETNGLDIDTVVNALNDEYAATGRSFSIQRVAGGYHLSTLPEYATYIRQLYLGRHKNRLTQAALETLAIVAFKQPVSRIDIAQIRGVDPDGVLKNLLDRRLITISGRSEGIGRPLLYSTTPEFLQYFGLNDLSQLPKPREIEELFGKGEYSPELLEALSQTEDPRAASLAPLPIDEATPSVESTSGMPVDSTAITENEQTANPPAAEEGGSGLGRAEPEQAAGSGEENQAE